MIAANESTRQPAFEMGDSCVPETEQHHSKPDTKMKTMKIALSFTAAVMLVGKAESADSPTKPNIVVILADDISETKNLAASMPEKVAEMKALLEKLITDGRSTPGAQQPNDVEVKRYPAKTAAAPKKKAKAAK